MKNKYLIIFFLLFIYTNSASSQVITTEDFEDETQNASSFTSNGQVFNISSQAGGTFDIYYSTSQYGWNGTIKSCRT